MTTGPGRKTRPIRCSSYLHRQLHTPEVKPRPLPLPAKGVKQVRSFMREKKIYCGKHYREVDIYPYTAAQLTASTRGKRSKKIKETEPKQKNLNDKNARRYFTQTANLNFGSDPEALHVTATYSGKYLPDTVEQAEQEATNFLRRVQYRRISFFCRLCPFRIHTRKRHTGQFRRERTQNAAQ